MTALEAIIAERAAAIARDEEHDPDASAEVAALTLALAALRAPTPADPQGEGPGAGRAHADHGRARGGAVVGGKRTRGVDLEGHARARRLAPDGTSSRPRFKKSAGVIGQAFSSERINLYDPASDITGDAPRLANA